MRFNDSLASRSLLEIERSLCLSSEIETVSDEELRSVFEAGFAWIERFIMQPHPGLGRKGAVCPFAHPAHEARSMYFCALDAREMRFDVFIEVMMRLPALFERLAAGMAGRSGLLSLCVFPVHLRSESYYKFIDCAHAMLKPFYMNTGLMLGEFHPLSAVRGARSDLIFPMRADVPIFVIRSIAVHDILFIDRDSEPAALRIHELECYLHGTSTLLPLSEVARVKERIDRLKSQLIADEDERSVMQMISV
ncbi:MAG TPA: hypothetical protein VGZ01_04850 [Trinickia sp.]|nr:hypothetical protein [Trinickia sp.]